MIFSRVPLRNLTCRAFLFRFDVSLYPFLSAINHNCFHLAIVLKIVAAQILIRLWKQVTIARWRIPLNINIGGV